MPRKARSDSVDSAVKAMVDAAKGLPNPPSNVHLRSEDLPFWRAILRARGKDEWGKTDLVVAAQLARVQTDIEREEGVLAAEGNVVQNARGSAINPRLMVVEMLMKREMALMRTLRLAGAALGDVRTYAARQRARNAAEEAREELENEEDDLLAS